MKCWRDRTTEKNFFGHHRRGCFPCGRSRKSDRNKEKSAPRDGENLDGEEEGKEKSLFVVVVDDFPVSVDDPLLQERAPFLQHLIGASRLRARFGTKALEERGEGGPEEVEAEGDKGLRKKEKVGRWSRLRKKRTEKERKQLRSGSLSFSLALYLPARRPLRGRCSGVASRRAEAGALGPLMRRTTTREKKPSKVFFFEILRQFFVLPTFSLQTRKKEKTTSRHAPHRRCMLRAQRLP